jgi:conjugative relaxase-like TrwC/TraI family protein
MLTIRAMSDGSGYSARHLQHSDYYAEGDRITGEWQGRGAHLLGLRREVRIEQFEALRQGLDPESGEFLRQRQSADRISADGTTQSRGRSLYDFTISAPKSVSIMAEVGGDGRLIDAHRTAVRETLTELEQHASARVRMDSANHNRSTGNLVLAVYHHDTSRELDPQLHAHAVAANLTYDGAEGRWKALQASGIYERRAYLTEVYRNALAREVRSLGYEIENRRAANGKDLGFEIKGVPEQLLQKYSQRSEQRDQAIAEFIKINNRPPTDNEVAILVRESRANKLIEISSVEVRSRQQARLSPGEQLSLEQSREQAHARSQTQQHGLDSPGLSLDYAERHIFERVSVTAEHQLLTEALRYSRGQIQLSELKGELSLQETRGEILRAGQEVATRMSLNREREMIARIDRGIGRFEPLNGQCNFTILEGLHPEQKKAVEFVLDSRDLAVNVRGAAGTGKTATLQEIRETLRASGRQVTAIAPTMSAVEELRKVGFENAMSVERLLQSQSAPRDLRGNVLIVDEAGMISGRQMSEILKMAEQNATRIVFSGDTRQIRSVEACDALRILEKESGLNSISLTGVQRQSVESYREAIKELRHDPERGFDRLEAMGAIREVAWLDRAHAVQQAYFEAKSEPNLKGQPRNVLIVASTHEEIRQVTVAIRAELARRGELGNSVPLETYASLSWTSAEKTNLQNYREGQVIKFHRAVGGVERNAMLRVFGLEGDRIIAKNARGEERSLTVRQTRCFEVYERRQLEVAPNDRLLLMSNRQDANFHATNGELVTVSRIDEQNRIHLQDGRALPEDYKEFAHGYAVTAHRSQGKSVDTVVVSADGMHKELFYVAASRGRESIAVVTSKKEVLRETITYSEVRQSASELAARSRSQSPKNHHSLSLRATYRSPSVVAEPEIVAGNVNQLSEKRDIAGTSQIFDHNQGTAQSSHEHAAEQSHSLGMAR